MTGLISAQIRFGTFRADIEISDPTVHRNKVKESPAHLGLFRETGNVQARSVLPG